MDKFLCKNSQIISLYERRAMTHAYGRLCSFRDDIITADNIIYSVDHLSFHPTPT